MNRWLSWIPFASRADENAAAEMWIDGLRARCVMEAAPQPSAALEQIFAWGPRPEPERRSVVAAWLPTPSAARPRVRIRVAAAVLAVTLLTGGLAAAGALPGPLQDAVAKLADMVGADLPHANDGSGARTGPGNHGPGASPNGAPGAAPAGDVQGTTSPTNKSSVSTGPGSSAPGIGSVPTIPGIDLPPIEIPGLPGIDVPSITVPPIELPGLPPITLPPIGS